MRHGWIRANRRPANDQAQIANGGCEALVSPRKRPEVLNALSARPVSGVIGPCVRRQGTNNDCLVIDGRRIPNTQINHIPRSSPEDRVCTLIRPRSSSFANYLIQIVNAACEAIQAAGQIPEVSSLLGASTKKRGALPLLQHLPMPFLLRDRKR